MTDEEKPDRRLILKGALGAGLGAAMPTTLQAAKAPADMRPQPGDILVYRFGDERGVPIKPSDVVLGDEIIQATAMEPQSEVIRDGSRLNGINLVRVEPDKIGDETKEHAAEGVLAYSSVCTHQGCDLTQWTLETTRFRCYCHYSEFDATDRGEPSHGPATRRLAVLPLQLTDDTFVVAAAFVGKVGFKRKR